MSNGTSTQVLPDLSERALRILPIAADLLPEEIVEARRERQARRLVLAGLAGFLALLTGWYGITLLETSAAGSGLAAAQDDISRLQAQQNKYADVVSAQAESHRIQAALGSLMANDLQWSRLVHDIGGAVPGEVTLAGVTGALNGSNQAGAVPDVQLPDHSGHKVVGTVTITGLAASKPAIASFVDALTKVNGLSGVLLVSTTADRGLLQFSIKANLTDAALGGRYTTKSLNGSGVK